MIAPTTLMAGFAKCWAFRLILVSFDHTQNTGPYLMVQFSVDSDLVLNVTESVLSDSDYCFVVAQSLSSYQNDIILGIQYSYLALSVACAVSMIRNGLTTERHCL